MDLIVGKWYKNQKWYYPNQDFIKFLLHNNENNIIGSEYINSGEYVDDKIEWYNDIDFCSEASPEEISKYLPDGHPDKIPEPLQQDKIEEFDSLIESIQKFKNK